MIELGKKHEFENIDKTLQPLGIMRRPQTFPGVSPDEAVICGYDQFVYTRLFWCQTVEDMQKLFDKAAGGGGFVSWYKSPMSFIEMATVEAHHLPWTEQPS